MARVESITGLEHMAARHTVPPAGNSPAGGEFRVDAEPDDPWLATYHYRGQDRQPPVLRTV